MTGADRCRVCEAPLELTLVDLGNSPLCESFLTPDQVERAEVFYPLHVRVCTTCWLGQLPSFVPVEDIFVEYAYFSAFSESWVAHARNYADMITERLRLTDRSLVVELASNDGYLLQHFVAKGIPVLGIDPAANVAEAAEERGVETIVDFFGVELAERLAREGRRADLIAGNNVLAQVPDLHDFLGGVAVLLAPDGTATFEFPHLVRLVEGLQYDTIYHEHYSYFSLASIETALSRHGLAVVDVEELPSHGGSLRVYAGHTAAGRTPSEAVARLADAEEAGGYRSPERYLEFTEQVKESKRALLDLLIRSRREGKQVVGYGAPGKGNTLLNYCGIRTDLLDYTVDRNTYKHGRFTPGTHIPIYPPERIDETRPDLIVILPWNLAREISTQLAYTAEWGAKLVVPVPGATVFEPGSVPEPDRAPRTAEESAPAGVSAG
jgi:predicted TPR repeat methyltransferase